MEIKVRAVSDNEEQKSQQQIEQELLNEHEKKNAEAEGGDPNDTRMENGNESSTSTQEQEDIQSESQAQTQTSELTEESVLSFMKNKYGVEAESLEELTKPRESQSNELPEDVAKYLNYKKETGRGFDDFMKLQKDFDSVDEDALLRDYLTATETGLDADDINTIIEDEYSFDEDLDDEKDIKKTKLRKKKTVAKAKEYFAKQQEQYKVPLESRTELSEAEAEEMEAYRNYIAEAKTMEESNKRKQEVFTRLTDDVFNEFKGFEFEVEGNKLVFNPGDAAEIKKSQLNPQNFINKFLNEEGLMQDAKGYHKALAMAMQPEKFAKFFYEQGMSAAADKTMQELKNVDMGTRRAPESTNASGMQIKSVSPSSGRGLRIKPSRNS